MSIKDYDIDEIAEGAIKLDGFDDAIIWVTEEFGCEPRILYSKHRILEILTKDSDMTWSEAEEYYDFNVLGLYPGKQPPIFLITE